MEDTGHGIDTKCSDILPDIQSFASLSKILDTLIHCKETNWLKVGSILNATISVQGDTSACFCSLEITVMSEIY